MPARKQRHIHRLGFDGYAAQPNVPTEATVIMQLTDQEFKGVGYHMSDAVAIRAFNRFVAAMMTADLIDCDTLRKLADKYDSSADLS